jgi:hypothetical protein
MDTLYYSNKCNSCGKLLTFLRKYGIIDKINAICIDKRTTDPRTGQYIIQLESGKTILLPVGIHTVPSLLTGDKKKIISGFDIVTYYRPLIEEEEERATRGHGEPMGYDLGNSSSLSESFASYSDETKPLTRTFVGADHNMGEPIHAPPDTYKPNKVPNSVTIDTLHSHRQDEIKRLDNNETNELVIQADSQRLSDAMSASAGYALSPSPKN